MPDDIPKQQPANKPTTASPAYKNPWLLLAFVIFVIISFAPLILEYAALRFAMNLLTIAFLLFYVILVLLVGYAFLKMWQKGQSARTRAYIFFVFVFLISAVTTIRMLSVLLAFGAFSSIPTPQCSVVLHMSGGVPAYSCSNLTMNTDGTISLNLSQNFDFKYYNFRIACTNSTENVHTGSELVPSVYPKWSYLTSVGSLSSTYSPSNSYALSSRKEVQVTGLPCYKTADEPLGNIPEGAIFNGTIWISYTPSPGPENSSNFSYDWVDEPFAAIIVKAAKQS
jgi:uncharacterized membrane protein (DUF485 family)